MRSKFWHTTPRFAKDADLFCGRLSSKTSKTRELTSDCDWAPSKPALKKTLLSACTSLEYIFNLVFFQTGYFRWVHMLHVYKPKHGHYLWRGNVIYIVFRKRNMSTDTFLFLGSPLLNLICFIISVCSSFPVLGSEYLILKNLKIIFFSQPNYKSKRKCVKKGYNTYSAYSTFNIVGQQELPRVRWAANKLN